MKRIRRRRKAILTMDAFCLVVDSRKSEFWGKMSEKSTTRSEEKIFRRRKSEWTMTSMMRQF